MIFLLQSADKSISAVFENGSSVIRGSGVNKLGYFQIFILLMGIHYDIMFFGYESGNVLISKGDKSIWDLFHRLSVQLAT